MSTFTLRIFATALRLSTVGLALFHLEIAPLLKPAFFSTEATLTPFSLQISLILSYSNLTPPSINFYIYIDT
nr:MAG TPA: hypothetical protein [Caudoviricetes sp.]DAU83200.1 MAG TPA: hypothetical protein [Bacteriophage sp.]